MHQISGSSDLVGQIAGFTSLRDADLLELSLLKSIYSIVSPIEVSLVSVDRDNKILKSVDYTAGHKNAAKPSDLDPEKFSLACDQLDNSNLDYCTAAYEDGSLSLFLLSQDRKVAQLVVIIAASIGISKTHSQQIIGMLEIYRNFRALLRESQTDELTGLSNRKTFEYTASRIHEQAVAPVSGFLNERRTFKAISQYWVVMIDIDHFKRVNDTRGHIIGDEVLVRVTQALQGSIRAEDHLYRYGGEEFAAIVRADTKKDCAAILERCREAVESLNFSEIGPITISVGAAEMDPMAFYLSNVEKADQALYFSKENGRNQLNFYSDIQPSSSAVDSSTDVDLF